MTVRKAGQLVLTEAAVAMLGEGVEHVQIGYNAKSRVVGIRPAADGVRGALKLRGSGARTPARGTRRRPRR